MERNVVFFNAQGRLRNGWKALLFLLFVSLLGMVSFGLLHILHVQRLPAWLPGPWIDASIVLAVTFAALALEKRPLHSVGFRLNGRWAAELAAGTLGGVLLITCTALLVLGLGGFHWVRNPAVGPLQLLGGAWMFLAVGFNEEGMFRGYLFQRMEEGLGPWPTQLILAFLFAFVHWGNPGMSGATRAWASLNIGLAAILLGACYLKTRSLALPIGVHLGWNWAQGYLYGFNVSGTEAHGWWTPVLNPKAVWVNGGAFGLEGTLACALVCSAFIVLVYLWKPTPPAWIETQGGE